MEQIFHIVNRGVDKRVIFTDNQDYLRFIHNLFEFNDTKPANNLWYTFRKERDIGNSDSDVRHHYTKQKRDVLVDILAFCLMPNHYHLLLSPKKENSVPLFMKKLNGGYAKYFNIKHERTGTLFERRYKSVPIQEHSHFLFVPFYIHLNPLDLIMPSWRDGIIPDSNKAIEFLENYRWSSFPDYVGKKNFPSVTSRTFLTRFFENSNHKNDMITWAKEREENDAYFE